MNRADYAVTADDLYDLVANMWRLMPDAPPEDIAGAVLACSGMRPIDNPICYAAALQALIVMAMDVDADLRFINPILSGRERMH